MPRYEFEVVVGRSMNGSVIAQCSSFVDCASEGETVDEAVGTLLEALELWSACIDA